MKEREIGYKLKDIIFKLEGHYFGFEINSVREVISTKSIDIEYVPDINVFFSGIIRSSSGEQVPIIDIFLLLSETTRVLKFKKDSCVVIFDVGDMTLGVYMDGAVSVVEIPTGEFRSALETSNVSHVYPFISDIFIVDQKGIKMSVKQIDYEKLVVSLGAKDAT